MQSKRTGYAFSQDRLRFHSEWAISIYLGPVMKSQDRLCVQSGQTINSVRIGYAFIQDRLSIQLEPAMHGYAFRQDRLCMHSVRSDHAFSQERPCIQSGQEPLVNRGYVFSQDRLGVQSGCIQSGPAIHSQDRNLQSRQAMSSVRTGYPLSQDRLCIHRTCSAFRKRERVEHHEKII